MSEIRDMLEGLYEKYNRHELIAPDPLQWVYKFNRRADREIAGFLAAALAYGRVEQINNDLGKLFGVMGRRPAEYAGNFAKADRKALAGFKHRFTTGEDIADLLEVFAVMLGRWGSLEKCFVSSAERSGLSVEGEKRGESSGQGEERRAMAQHGQEYLPILRGLERFCGQVGQIRQEMGKEFTGGLRYLVTNPADGSACKRMNLFLRWMVRKDDVDAGLWKGIDRAKLVVPVDVHIARLTRILGFHSRATTSIWTAMDITAGFAAVNPADPVKYDFALSRIGIVEGCTGKAGRYCSGCELVRWCGRKNSKH